MKTSKLIYYLRKWYPEWAGYEGDFIGLQTGELKEHTNTIVLCLDFDHQVFNRIKGKHVDLILTHHPLLYGNRDEILSYDEVKRALIEKIDRLHIPCYSMHTNFDGGKKGMNAALAEKLGLVNVHPLKNEKLCRGGTLPKAMDINDFAKMVKRVLKLPKIYLINKGKKRIKKVALCGGSGAGDFVHAMNEGYDIFLSGDAPHHIRHDVSRYHFNYIEIMHEVEQIFIEVMYKRLKSLDPKLKIIRVPQEYPKFI